MPSSSASSALSSVPSLEEAPPAASEPTSDAPAVPPHAGPALARAKATPPKKPKATGTIERRGEVVYARISLVDGSRPWVLLGKGLTDLQARKQAKKLSDRARAERWVKNSVAKPAADEGERTDDWFARYFAFRDNRGIKGLRQERDRYASHLSPLFGKRPLRTITRQEVEQLVARLDERVRAREMSWRSAGHVWAMLSHALKEACSSKRLDLRVREDNPAAGVRGPDRGRDKAKQFLYPSELLAILVCERVPVRWKRLIALSAYAYPRPGELEALVCEDVDLVHGVLHIHQAADDEGEARGTKTGMVRLVPIEPTLRPLLEVLLEEQGKTGRLVTMPPEEDLSERLRRYAQWAGVTRPALFVDPKHPTLKRLTWYDLRATGITWRAVRGDNPTKLHLAAGHEDLKTTMIYIRTAEASAPAFGEVFPVLPEVVLSRQVDSSGATKREESQSRLSPVASPAGFEPALQP